jgi:hypothetical protein
VVGPEPPVGEPNDAGDADAGKGGDEDAIDRPDRSCRAVPPELVMGQRTSARLSAAATKV